jgi:excisionase family DNA binding protein
MDDRLMTIKQLATYLSVNERTVLKLVQDGAIPGVKVGNQWRFRKAMIDTWAGRPDARAHAALCRVDTTRVAAKNARAIEMLRA